MKQRRPAATDDGMNDDAVLVDEPQLLERSRELGRSDENTPLDLRFQRRDRLAKVTLYLDRVLPRKVAPRARHDVLRLRLELLCPLAHRARRLFVACHCGPGSLHQLVGVAPEEHRPALIHELRPIVVQLVVHDPLGVIDAPVQSHVETEGEEAHGVGFYQKRAQRAAARAIDAMPHPRWVSARRNSTPSNPSPGSAAHWAQKSDPIAGDTPRDSSNGYRGTVTMRKNYDFSKAKRGAVLPWGGHENGGTEN